MTGYTDSEPRSGRQVRLAGWTVLALSVLAAGLEGFRLAQAGLPAVPVLILGGLINQYEAAA